MPETRGPAHHTLLLRIAAAEQLIAAVEHRMAVAAVVNIKAAANTGRS
jgi:hypothetical protein